MMRVGFIGLGEMGGGMVQRIIAAGFPTMLWARRPEVLSEYGGASVETASTPAELAAAVDLVAICVWADDDVREVLERDDGVLAGSRPGTVIAVHSTISPDTCRELAAKAEEHGVTLLDAPVSGGRDVALAGALTVMIGGDADVVARVRAVFETFGDPVLHVGPVGAAQAAKLINNALLTANLALADDALTLGAALGVWPEPLHEMLRAGSGRSYALDVVSGFRASPEMRQAASPALEKDLRALVAAADSAGAVPELLRSAADEALRRLGQAPAGWTQ